MGDGKKNSRTDGGKNVNNDRPAAENLHKGHRSRLRGQYLESGLSAFSDHQIAELLLFYVLPQKDTNEIAHRLINKTGDLAGIFSKYTEITEDDLKDIGLSAGSLMFFRFIEELYKQKFPAYRRGSGNIMQNPEGADVTNFLYTLFGTALKAEKTRCFAAAVFSNDLASIRTEVLYRSGSAGRNGISRKAASLAVTENAAMAAAAWRVPEDIAAPSGEDMLIFEQLRDIYGSIGVYFIDYLIIGEKSFFSFRRSCPGEFG